MKCLTVVVVNNSFCELKRIEEVSSVVLVDLMVVSTVETKSEVEVEGTVSVDGMVLGVETVHKYSGHL